MKIIAIVESDDYSGAAIVDPTYITITKFGDFYLGATRCMFSHKPITCEISTSDAEKLIGKGVQYFDLTEDKSSSKNNKIKKIKKQD
jgi:hypothetical protein